MCGMLHATYRIACVTSRSRLLQVVFDDLLRVRPLIGTKGHTLSEAMNVALNFDLKKH